MSEQHTQDTPQSTAQVKCPAAKDPAVRLFIGAAMLLGFAIYCLVDPEDAPEAWTFEHVNQIGRYVLHVGGPFGFGLPGIAVLLMAVRFLKRILIANENGIGYEGKGQIAWDQVTELDASELKAKGILYLHAGKTKLTLDSWKLDNFRELVAIVEANVPADKKHT